MGCNSSRDWRGTVKGNTIFWKEREKERKKEKGKEKKEERGKKRKLAAHLQAVPQQQHVALAFAGGKDDTWAVNELDVLVEVNFLSCFRDTGGGSHVARL